jgi:transcriptional regulator with XRE-family HTH domain
MNVPFGLWLRQLREDRGEILRVTAAAIDVDSTLLSKIERGERFPTESQAEFLAKHFGLERDELKSRLVAARILHEYGSDPAFPQAISIVREESRAYPQID